MDGLREDAVRGQEEHPGDLVGHHGTLHARAAVPGRTGVPAISLSEKLNVNPVFTVLLAYLKLLPIQTLKVGSLGTHKTLGVGVYASAPSMFSFEVLAWGSERFGVAYDATFHRFFHQLARVRVSGPSAVGKWTSPPTELYLVEGTIPAENFALFREVLSEINQESVSELWCGTAGPLPITIGPDVVGQTTG